jgi:flagellar biosynthesis/type III secretory pathway protein FliH
MTDPDAIAADPAMGVLSAMFHAGPDDTLDAVVQGHDKIAEADRLIARRYYDWVSALLPEAARKTLREKMKTASRWYSEDAQAWIAEGIAEGKAQGLAEGKAEGKAEGEAKSVLLFLEARGIEVTDEQRQRILQCADLQQLETWVRRAATVSSADELFD